MVILVKLIGILIFAISLIYGIKPSVIKGMIGFWKKGKRIYAGGVINLIIAILFLLAASDLRMPWIAIVIGLLSLAKALAIFLLGPDKLMKSMDFWLNKSDFALRMISLIGI
ncbi:MAG: hypothetical protein HQ572_05275, partial [Candidatus Omnitrophica bacterium]|nr:hypothetical protein [Candidatus Omnitrophota bacterium]